MEWQDISTAPTDESTIIVCGGEWEGEIAGSRPLAGVALVTFDGRRFSEVGGDYYSSWVNKPTHWMPLPKPPQSKEHDRHG